MERIWTCISANLVKTSEWRHKNSPCLCVLHNWQLMFQQWQLISPLNPALGVPAQFARSTRYLRRELGARERAKKYINTDFLVEHDIHDNDGLFVLLFSGKCWTGARGWYIGEPVPTQPTPGRLYQRTSISSGPKQTDCPPDFSLFLALGLVFSQDRCI